MSQQFPELDPEDLFDLKNRKGMHRMESQPIDNIKPENDGAFALVTYAKDKGAWVPMALMDANLEQFQDLLEGGKPQGLEIAGCFPGSMNELMAAMAYLRLLEIHITRGYQRVSNIKHSN